MSSSSSSSSSSSLAPSMAFAEEIEALEAIYGDEFTVDDHARYRITLPALCEFLFWASELYPEHAPPRYRIELAAGLAWRTREASGEVADALQRRWEDGGGGVVVYEWVEWLRGQLPSHVVDAEAAAAAASSSSAHATNPPPPPPPVPLPTIHHGPVFTDRKSRFQAHIARATTMAEVAAVVGHIRAAGSRWASATHNIVAYRLVGSGPASSAAAVAAVVGEENRDDDGEGGAGDRMLYLMQKMRVADAVAVVTRWYGGVPLGPDRFKAITGVLKALIEEAGFAGGGGGAAAAGAAAGGAGGAAAR